MSSAEERPERRAFLRSAHTTRVTGPTVIVGLVAAWAGIWFILRPSGQATASYVGQLFGAESVLCLSIALVLISTLPVVEVWFDGIDHAAIWHRRFAITGFLLLVPHILLATNPHQRGPGKLLAIVGAVGLLALVLWAIVPRWRSVVPRVLRPAIVRAHALPGIRHLRTLLGGYERWRAFHRLTGLFLAVGFLHGVLDGTPFAHAPALRAIYIAIGGIGLAFYAYRELAARRLLALHDYQVVSIAPLDNRMIELSLKPLGEPLPFTPGQFAMLFLETASGWRRHPFSMTSSPHADLLRFNVKALGDDTTAMPTEIQPGMPAVIRGPFGRFSHAKGGDHQLWIAGGVGVTPFLSWFRSLDEDPIPQTVDFFYSSRDEDSLLADELTAIAARHDELHIHLVRSSVEGRLTTTQVLAAARAVPAELSVFLCGPEQMVRTFENELRGAGVRAGAIYREYFVWR